MTTVTKKGMNVEISQEVNDYLQPITFNADRPHVNRVKKAMLMQIEEMRMHPNWIAFLKNSQNENK